MKNRVCQTIVIAAFFTVIAVPLLMFQKPGRVSQMMNKVTADWSSVAEYSPLDADFTAAIDEVISDNIGLKDDATALNIAAMYRLFGKIAIADYLVGEDGHFFWMPENIMQTYQGLDLAPEEQLENMARKFIKVADKLKDSGSRFIFMPIPNKDTVYREYVPDSIHVLSEENFFRQLTAYLLAETDVPVVDVESALLAHKSEGELLYWRNFDLSHWNDLGAFVGFQAVMQTASELDPEIAYPKQEDMSVSVEEIRKALDYVGHYSGLVQRTFASEPDELYSVSCPEPWQYGQLDQSVPAGFSLADDSQSRYYHYHNDNASSDKSVLIYGDSYTYTYFLLPAYSMCFQDVYYLAYGEGAGRLAELMSLLEEPPEFVVWEIVSRMTNYGNLAILLADLELNAEHDLVLPEGLGTDVPYSTHSYNIRVDTTGGQTAVSVPELAVDGKLVLDGWAVDLNDMTETGGVIAVIGDKQIGAARVIRPDLGQAFEDGGFELTIPLEDLEGASEIQIYALTPDGSTTYPPLELQVVR